MSPATTAFAIIRCVLGAWAVYLPGETFANYFPTYGAAWDSLAFAGWRCTYRHALHGDEDRFERIHGAEVVCASCNEPLNQELYGPVFRHPRCEDLQTIELAPDPETLPEHWSEP